MNNDQNQQNPELFGNAQPNPPASGDQPDKTDVTKSGNTDSGAGASAVAADSLHTQNDAYEELMRNNGYSAGYTAGNPSSAQQTGGNNASQPNANPGAYQSQQSGSSGQPHNLHQQNGYNTYRAPYGGQPYNGGYGYQQQNGGTVNFGAPQGGYYPPQQPAQPVRQPKYATRGALIWTVVICLLISLACGGVGFLAGQLSSGNVVSPILGGSGGNVNINNYTSEPAKPTVLDGTVESVVNAVSASVVEITTETVSTSTYYGQYITSGAGSGVIIDAQGYIITCHHVIDGATKITVKLTDGTTHEATIVGSDSETDLAVIRIEPGDKTLTAVAFGDSDSLVIGQAVVAIGNPLGSLGGTVTTGIISATEREIEIDGQKYTLLQTNAAINPGNSGGGLFDMNGHLIGIVNAKSSGDNIEGLGFAIPGTNAKDISSQLIAYGYIKGRVQIGLRLFEIQSQDDYAKWIQYGRYFSSYGIYIAESANTDFSTGDRIVAFDGTEVSTLSELKAALSKCTVGQEVTITVSRLTGGSNKSQLVEIKVTLTEKTA